VLDADVAVIEGVPRVGDIAGGEHTGSGGPQRGIGLDWVLVCFAGLCLMAIAFVYRFVPETKGHSVEEITRIFDREAERGVLASAAAGGTIQFNSDPNPEDIDGIVIDCRGLAARDTEPELRGVKGEMIIVETSEIEFTRPVRLIHPRWPLYIIPRAGHQFMIGATSIEAEDRGVSVRSALELLSAAYAVHPAFAEARIVEFGSGLRPAFPDNLPRIAIDGEKIAVNGLYRHGFLLAPALAELTLGYVERGVIDNEVMQCA